MTHIVVIGAGQAGSSLVAGLRKGGFAGDITLIGAEPVPPYQRPPLSKGYLLGDVAQDRLLLRPESFYADQRIDLVLGQRVQAIDRAARTVTLATGPLVYDQLALTTGSDPRRLPASVGGDLGGVFTLRNLADIDAMAPLVSAGARVLIVGGGYIGLEAAAVCAKRGLKVTVVEMAEPDEELLAQVMLKLFADRQVAVDDKVILWLVARMERSLAAGRRIVARLDQLALARGSKITRALAAEVMAEMDAGIDDTELS